MHSSTIAYKVLQLKAKRAVYTLLNGNTLSNIHGEGYDFAQIREYQMGDDIRKINWTITAKFAKPYIKELHSNRELSIIVCALMDGSLYFGEGNAKQHKLTEIASILGYASHYSNDLFRGIQYTQNHIYTTPPTKQLYHISQYTQSLYDSPLLDTTLDKDEAIKELFSRLTKSSLIFVLGDFLEEVDLSILSQKHDVVAIIIRDTEEEYPKILGETTLINPKNQSKLDIFWHKKAIENYKSKLKQHDDKLLAHLNRYNIRHIKILTTDDSVSRLMRLFT